MANKKIKGITIEIGGDTTKLGKAIEDSEKQSKALTSELRQVEKLLKFDPTNTDLLAQKQKILSDNVNETCERLYTLKEAEAQVVEQFERGEIGEDQLRAFQREIIKTESDLNKLYNELTSYTDEMSQAAAETAQTGNALDSLTDDINRQENELNQLKEEYANVILGQGKTSREAIELAGKIQRLTGELKDNRDKMDDATGEADRLTRALDNTEDATEDTGKGFSRLDGFVSNFAANIATEAVSAVSDLIGNIMELSEATEEYRIMQNKLDGSATSFGYSMEFVKGKYAEFYKYVSDDQMATNAITNLLGMKVSTQSVTEMVQGAIGVWSAYGDSIPIESLTESITETVNVSKVTGTLADTINWASLTNEQWTGILGKGSTAQKAFNKAIEEGIPVEDAFNDALAATSEKQERANMVAGMLNETYGKSKQTYDKLSGSILDANAAELELKETQAELGATLEPVNASFDRLQSKVLKAMAPTIKEVAGEFNDFLNDIDWNDVANDMGDMFDVAMDGLEWMGDNIDPISAAVKGLAAAWLAQKTAAIAASGATAAGNAVTAVTELVTKSATAGTIAHTVATKAATVAQKAFNLAQKANPIGLVASLVLGAGVAIASYVSSTKKATETVSENTKETNALVNEYKELNDQLTQSKQAREDAVASTEAEYMAADKMVGRLDALAQKENKSNGEKALMKQYVDQLNELMPDLNLQYDAEKDKLNMSTEAIRANIDATKQLTLAKAAQDNLAKIAQDLVRAETQMGEASLQAAENEEKYLEAKKKTEKAFDEWYKSGQKMYGSQYEAWKKAAEAETEAEKNHKKTKKTVEDLEKEVKDLNKEYENTEKFAENALNSADLEKALQDLTTECKEKGIEVPQAVADGIREGNYTLPQSVDEMNLLITFDSLTQKAADAGIEVPKSISEGIASGQLAPSAAITQMNNLIDFDDLLTKAGLAGQDVPKWVTNGIVSGQFTPQQAVQTMKDLVQFNDLTDEAKDAGAKVPKLLKDNVLAGKTSPAEAVQQMEDLIQFHDLLRKSDAAGRDVPKEIQEGILSGKLSPKQAVDLMNVLAINAAAAVKSSMRKAGSKNANAYGQGMDDKKANVKNSGAALGAQGAAGVRSKYGDFSSAGAHVAGGIQKGARSKDNDIFSSMRNLASSMVDSFKKALKINSPSKVFADVAESVPEGAAFGVERNRDVALEAVSNLADDMVNEMRFDEDLFNPTAGINGLTIQRSLNTTFGYNAPADNTAELVTLVSEYFPKLINASQKSIVLDTGVLVGETVNLMDEKLSQNYELKARGI